MVQDGGGYLVKAVLPGGIAGLLHAHEHLELELDGRKRVLEVVRHAAGHVGPGLVPFYLGQAARTLSQHLHHTVVGL